MDGQRVLSVIVIMVGVILYGLTYKLYVRWYDRKIIQSDPEAPTPAHIYMDGVEFFPTNRYVMLGFHWKSIAALGPVVGPIIAIQWGWLPGLLWLLFGNMFIGWLHDYSALMVSVRSDGASLGPITYQLVSPRARNVLIGFLSFYLVLVFAAFTAVLVPVFKSFPVAPLPVLFVTFVGVATGYAVFRYRVNIVAVTGTAIALMALSVWMGGVFPVTAPFADPLLTEDFWIVMILIFSLLGAVLPIWSFMQPINYLSFYLVYFGVIAIILGAIIGHPTFGFPAFTTFFNPSTTPSGPLWPIMFVTIACGACSGWHGLLGTSVSSKQLENEADGAFVGGGSMLMEGILGLTSLIAVAILSPVDIKGVSALGQYILGGSKFLGFIGFPAEIGESFVSVMVIILAITVMQIVLRLARLTFAEMLGARIFKNIYVSAGIVMAVTYFLASSRFGATWVYIWTLFGGANQLMAALCLMISTLWLVSNNRPAKYVGIPMLFMMGTTITALLYTAYVTIGRALSAPPAGAPWFYPAGNGVSGIIGILLVVLALILCHDGWKGYMRIRAEQASPVKT